VHVVTVLPLSGEDKMPKLSKQTIAAVQKYGPTVQAVAKQYGISGAALLAKLVEGESGDNPDAVSSVGAKGRAQFMPDSRQTAIQKYGVDPWSHDPDQAVHAAALHLRGLINGSKGLAGYNPGDPSYTGYILGQKVGDVSHYGSGGGDGPRVAPRVATQQQRTTTTTTPGVDNSGLRRQLVAGFLQHGGVGNPNAVLALAGQYGSAADVPGTTKTTTTTTPGPRVKAPKASPSTGGSGKVKGGTVTFDGKRVARWIGEALQYAREQGWQGTVNSGYRSDAEQKRIYDSGVRPAAKPQAYGGGGSNHEFTVYPGGAVDVSDAQALSKILSGSKWRGKLVWAGAKDPVHFSKPHNGSY
jgi:hypothetical protein